VRNGGEELIACHGVTSLASPLHGGSGNGQF
jgi:hypothetical protein